MRQELELPDSLDDLLELPQKKPITAIFKRGTDHPVEFDPRKIAEAVRKASIASGIEYTDNETSEFATEVERELQPINGRFEHSGSSIPNIEDVQDTVLKIFDTREERKITNFLVERTGDSVSKIAPIVRELISGLDHTSHDYKQYMDARARVRANMVNLPYSFGFDSTDKQLLIQDVQNGESHPFNADALTKFILEQTNVSFKDAEAAVKRTEQVISQRGTDRPIEPDEITAIIDTALMERGNSKENLISGKNLSLTFGDIDQIVFQRSVENSNIQSNNPEAVNLGIAELVLKQYGLRTLFDKDIAQAHKDGRIHIHDLGYPTRVYCSAHSIEYLKKFGLDVVVRNLDAKSKPATTPSVLNNHVHTLMAAIQSSYAGALGFPMLNTLYGPMLLEEIEMVEGFELFKDDSGKTTRVPKRIKRKILEDLMADGGIQGFEETKSTNVLKLLSKKELKQKAQNLIFGSSQSAFSRGGQTLFIDFNIDGATPPYVAEVPALFARGNYLTVEKNGNEEWEIVDKTIEPPERYEGLMVDNGHGPEPDKKNGDVIQPKDGKLKVTYGHELVEKASRQFAEALLEVAAEGDKYGNLFNFPKIDFHVSRETFENEDQMALLRKACEVIEKNDSVYIMFDRGDGMNVSQCCRLRERITDPSILKYPEKMRFCGFQNVSINLPQAAFRAEGDTLEARLDSTLEEIDKSMVLALKAHTNKRRYIQHLLDTDGSPLRAMGLPSDDGDPYIDLTKSTYIFGVIGLNEAVQSITGKEMHEDPESLKVGLRIVSHMYSTKDTFTKKYKMKFVIEETPGESSNRRLAKIDQINYPEKSRGIFKGNVEEDTFFYTNSSHLRADAPVSGLDRAIIQSMMNPMIEAGAITHLFTGEKENRANAVYDFVESMFYNTQSSQIVFSGEHTVCLKCSNHERGLIDICGKCGNDDPERMSQKTRIVGYNSDPRTWHKSKQGELQARQETVGFYSGQKESLRDLEAELLESIIEPGKIRIGIAGSPDCVQCTMAYDKVMNYLKRKVPEHLRYQVEIVKYDVQNEEDRVNMAIYGAPIDTYPTVVVHQEDRFERKNAEYPYKGKPNIITTGDIDKMFKKIVNEAA